MIILSALLRCAIVIYALIIMHKLQLKPPIFVHGYYQCQNCRCVAEDVLHILRNKLDRHYSGEILSKNRVI